MEEGELLLPVRRVLGRVQVEGDQAGPPAPPAPMPGDDNLPYVVAMVELAEGVRMLSTVVGCAPEEVRIGMPMAVIFDPVTPEVTLPRFRPV